MRSGGGGLPGGRATSFSDTQSAIQGEGGRGGQMCLCVCVCVGGGDLQHFITMFEKLNAILSKMMQGKANICKFLQKSPKNCKIVQNKAFYDYKTLFF